MAESMTIMILEITVTVSRSVAVFEKAIEIHLDLF